MKKLMELGDNYAKASTWKDFALVKFCLFSMGLFFGTLVAEENKKTVIVMSIIVFTATYIPLMAKVIRIAKKQ